MSLMAVWCFGWGSKLGRVANQAPLPDEDTGLALQMGRSAAWYLCLSADVRWTMVCEDLVTVSSALCSIFI